MGPRAHSHGAILALSLGQAAMPGKRIDDLDRLRRNTLAKDALEHRGVHGLDLAHRMGGQENVDLPLRIEYPRAAVLVGNAQAASRLLGALLHGRESDIRPL